MVAPYRVLEDLALFDVAISDRFEFRTVALFFADCDHQATRFVRAEFNILDELTGSDILLVSLAEPKGGYWRFLHERPERDTRDLGSIHTTIAERVKEKRELVQFTFGYEPQPSPPSREQLQERLKRMGLTTTVSVPFLLLYALPQ